MAETSKSARMVGKVAIDGLQKSEGILARTPLPELPPTLSQGGVICVLYVTYGLCLNQLNAEQIPG